VANLREEKGFQKKPSWVGRPKWFTDFQLFKEATKHELRGARGFQGGKGGAIAHS